MDDANLNTNQAEAQSVEPNEVTESKLAAKVNPLTEFTRGIKKAKGPDSWERSLRVAAQFLSLYPTHSPKVLTLLSEKFDVSESEVAKQITLQDEYRLEKYRFQEALSFLASRVEVDFSIDEILPKHLAEVIKLSCTSSNVDWKSALFLLLASTSGLTGNRVVCVSPRSHQPISLSLMVLNCGNSSANKDISSNKIVDALKGQAKLANLRHEEAMLEAKKITDPDNRKAQEFLLNSNRKDVLCTAISFSAESMVFDVSTKAPRNGYHVHQKEGSDFLACERWGAGQGQAASGPGLLRKTLMEAWDAPLDAKYLRQSSDRCATFKEQSLSLTLNCQMRFIPEIVDFDEDGLGWTSRLLVVLAEEMDTGESPRKCKGQDPLTEYVRRRLIPFTQAIELRENGEITPSGFVMDHVQLELDTWSGVEDRYEDFCNETKAEVSRSEAAGIEPAYLSFLKKTPVRIMKFASLLHIFQTLEGKQIPSAGREFNYEIFKPSCDPNMELLKNGGISLETFERAIKLELLARNQYQVVADLCRTAPALRDQRKEVGQDLTLAGVILEKLKRVGEINERQFKDKAKSRKFTRKEVSACIENLVEKGNIIRKPVPGKGSNNLAFNSELRI